MELVNSNTLLILSLRLTEVATNYTEQFNCLLQSTVPEMFMSRQTAQNVDVWVI